MENIKKAILQEKIKQGKKLAQENLSKVEENHPELNIHEQRLLAVALAEEAVFGNLDNLRK